VARIEPGESPADAAVREVKEEDRPSYRGGAEGVIGRRVHRRPGTQHGINGPSRTHGTDVFVGDERTAKGCDRAKTC